MSRPEENLRAFALLPEFEGTTTAAAMQSGADRIAELERESAAKDAAHKNLHRIICEASGYLHDEKDWSRDQASLTEWVRAKDALIAKLQNDAKTATREFEDYQWGMNYVQKALRSELARLRATACEEDAESIDRLLAATPGSAFAELTALREDKARIDAAQIQQADYHCNQDGRWTTWFDAHQLGPFATIREAMDAARKSPK